MEFTRSEADAAFFDEDEEIANSYLVWGEVAIHYADLYGRVGRQKDMTSFLLSIGKQTRKKCKQRHVVNCLFSIVKSIFMEMVSMDALIIKIMNFTQKLVSADRASLFLVDNKTNQLYARIFDVSGGKNTEENGATGEASQNPEKDMTKEIR